MDSNNSIGIIELGNINIKCLIFRINNDDTSEILSSSLVKSEGIHNSKIVNPVKAANAVRSCISIAEKKAKVFLKKINVVIEQPEFLCTKFSKHKKIDGSKIQKEDIEFLLKEAKKQVTLNDRTQKIIHIFNHNYIVDNKTFIEEPINVYADSLRHEMTFITMPKDNLKNINQVFIDCDIEVERLISCIFSLGVELLNYKQLQKGSILIDLGFEKTSLGIFKDLALIHILTLPIGVNHIVKDISKVCSLNLDESEIIKNNIDFSFIDNAKVFDDSDYLKKDFFNTSHFRKIKKSLIANVLKARLNEILEIVKKQIIVTGLNTNSETNIFITGGGSNILNLEKYFSNFFDLNVKKIGVKSNEGKNEKNSYANFSSCLGAFKIIKDGWETEAIPESVNKNEGKLGFFAGIFKGR